MGEGRDPGERPPRVPRQGRRQVRIYSGVFISLNGFTRDALEAITKGKQPTFFLLDGYDLVTVLEGQIDLPTLLRFKLRELAEEGSVLASAKDLLEKTQSREGYGD